MENVFLCCAGLDLHKKSGEACVRRMEPSGHVHQQTHHWGTMTRDILMLADWMAAQWVAHVAMESTGVYWKPIYNILESRFTVLLVNARHLKQVPGRKSHIRDCLWIAQLLQHGLLKGSFVVCWACSAARRCKSSTQPDGGEGLVMTQGLSPRGEV